MFVCNGMSFGNFGWDLVSDNLGLGTEFWCVKVKGECIGGTIATRWIYRLWLAPDRYMYLLMMMMLMMMMKKRN